MSQNLNEQYKEKILHAIKDNNITLWRELFLDLHPTDQAALFKMLDSDGRKAIYKHLSSEEFADVFQGLEFKEQKEVLLELDYPYAVDILNNMYSDDAADFLGEIDELTAQKFLDHMDHEEAQEVQVLLDYPDETAGAIMTTEYVAVTADKTVSAVLEQLRKEAPDAETIYYLYVIDNDGKLVGVISLRDLLVSGLDQKIKEIMNTNAISVSALKDQEEVAKVIKDYNFLAVPVVDDQGVLVGIVTVDDVMDVVEEETTEDFGEISAVKGAVDIDMLSREAAKRRLPWLVLLLFLGMITAGIIGTFEDTLGRFTALAVFIPLIAGMGGNIGTQSLAVVVRGLALEHFDRGRIIYLIKREAGTGIIIGLVCGILVALISQVVTGGNLILGFIVGVSLFSALIISALIGTIVPLVIHRFKIDPAVASGPFISTVNDIVSLTIYFSIATLLLRYL